MRKIGILGLCIIALTLGGCAGNQKAVGERKADDTVFVFGYVDMSDAPTYLRSFSMRQVKPKVQKPYWNARTHEGVFYMENMPVGSYQFSRFGGPGGFFSNVSYYYYKFPRQVGGFRMRKPGVYFVGSYKLVKGGNFINRKYDIQKTASPTPQQIREMIMPYVKGTRWEAELRKGITVLDLS